MKKFNFLTLFKLNFLPYLNNEKIKHKISILCIIF